MSILNVLRSMEVKKIQFCLGSCFQTYSATDPFLYQWNQGPVNDILESSIVRNQYQTFANNSWVFISADWGETLRAPNFHQHVWDTCRLHFCRRQGLLGTWGNTFSKITSSQNLWLWKKEIEQGLDLENIAFFPQNRK